MEKPNILIIMADQHRNDWLGCNGNELVKTPNIDKLAEKGMVFEQTACNSPLCGPSRAAMTGGVYPHRLGILDNKVNYPLERETVYQRLRANGYRVGVAGKTDLHKPDHFYGENGDRPLLYHLGFTDLHETEGKANARRGHYDEAEVLAGKEIKEEELVGPYQHHLLNKGLLKDFVRDYRRRWEHPIWYTSQSVLEVEDFHDGYVGERSCEFLENFPEESPWHLFVSFVGPHNPWDAPEKYYKLYQDIDFPDRLIEELNDKPRWVKERAKTETEDMSYEDLNQVKRHYAAMITLIDDYVGRFVDILEKRGQLENTVIIYTSDHGEMMGDHGLFTKQCMYEASLRVPLVVSGLGINQGHRSDALAELVDLYPTMLDMAGIDYDSQKLDGKTLLPVLTGEEENHKQYQVSDLYHTRMLYDGRYKYIYNINDRSELYNLKKDPEERVNIIDEKSEVADKMDSKLKEIRR